MSCTKVRVKLLPPPHLQALAGVSEEDVEVCGERAVVASVLRKLLEKHGRALYEQLYDEERGDFRNGVVVLVSDRIARSPREPLKSGDVLVITIAYEGG